MSEFYIKCSDCKYYNVQSGYCNQYKTKKADRVYKLCYHAKRVRGQPMDSRGKPVGDPIVEEFNGDVTNLSVEHVKDAVNALIDNEKDVVSPDMPYRNPELLDVNYSDSKKVKVKRKYTRRKRKAKVREDG